MSEDEDDLFCTVYFQELVRKRQMNFYEFNSPKLNCYKSKKKITNG
jgi:hypothetical protein